MKLNPAPFDMIRLGLKTVELRLYDEKRRQIKAGDLIEFTSTATGETLLCDVLSLHLFKSFAQLYRALPLTRCGYTEDDVGSASPDDMNAYYSPEEQEKYGVVGIEIKIADKAKKQITTNPK